MPFLQLRTSLLSPETVLPQSLSPITPNIHGLCSCMNFQHSKLFPPCHSLRIQHLLKPRSPLHLNNTLILHSNLITQDQQPLYLLSRCLAHLNFQNLMTGSLDHAWNDHTLSPAINKNTWPIRIFISQPRTCLKQNPSQTTFRALSSTSP